MSNPDPDLLRRAGEHLAAAADLAQGDAAERLDGLADQCTSLADRGRGPDHGRLARLLTSLSDIEASVGEDAAKRISEARAALTSYREDVEGV